MGHKVSKTCLPSPSHPEPKHTPITTTVNPKPKYTPLPSSPLTIRLVHLEPSTTPASQISCGLSNYNIGQAISEHAVNGYVSLGPKYEAISYEWGPIQPTKTILLNGNEHTIRENLYWALHNLRLKKGQGAKWREKDGDPYENRYIGEREGEEGERILWIDALCINQDDPVERAHQVKLMGSIYRLPSRVLIYLGGPQTSDASISTRITSTISCLNSKSYAPWYHPTNSSDTTSAATEQRIQSGLQMRLEPWPGLISIAQRTYWSRLWIIQELHLAPCVWLYWGPNALYWVKLEIAISKIDGIATNMKTEAYFRKNFHREPDILEATELEKRYAEALKTYEKPINDSLLSRHRRQHFLKGLPLLDLVVLYREAECERARDKMFGLLSMCAKCCGEAMVVDYRNRLEDCLLSALRHFLDVHCEELGHGGEMQQVSGFIERFLKCFGVDAGGNVELEEIMVESRKKCRLEVMDWAQRAAFV